MTLGMTRACRETRREVRFRVILGGTMIRRAFVFGMGVGLFSCARSATPSEGDGSHSPSEPRMRTLGMVGPQWRQSASGARNAPQTTGRRFAVSPLGSDTNPCSEKAPCREIQRAITLATVPGDMVLVADGDYSAFVVDGARGELSRPITIFATGNRANVRSEPNCKKKRCRDTIVIRDSRHFVIDGLIVHGAARAGIAIFYGHHVTVRHGEFGDNGRWGIFTSFADDVVLEYNDIFRSRREHGIYLSNSGDRPVVRMNVLHDNDGCGIHVNGDYREIPEMGRNGTSMYAGVVDGIVSGAVIEGNLIYRNGAGGIANKKRRGGAGINLDGVWDSVIQHNVLFDNAATGIAAFGDEDGVNDNSKEDGDGRFGPKGLVITHNTIAMPLGARNGLQIRASRGVNTVTGNILHHQDRRRAGMEMGTMSDAALVTSNKNVVDRISVADRVRPLDAWKKETGQDKESLSVPLERLFMDPEQGDYTLQSSSPAFRIAMPEPPNSQQMQQPKIQQKSIDVASAKPPRCPIGACLPPR